MTHHISIFLRIQIQFGLFRFRSPLLTESRIDFSSSSYSDASLRTVRSSKLKHGSVKRDLIRRSWVQRSHAPTPSLSQLATSFIAYQAESSSNRRLCTSLFIRSQLQTLQLYANCYYIMPHLCGPNFNVQSEMIVFFYTTVIAGSRLLCPSFP